MHKIRRKCERYGVEVLKSPPYLGFSEMENQISSGFQSIYGKSH